MKPRVLYPLTFLFLFLFYFHAHRAEPSIGLGDSAELAAVGGTLGIGHSPGYPLFSILGKIGCVLTPWGTIAYRVNLQSAAWSAAAAAVVALCVTELTASLWIGLLAGLLLGICPLWIDQATVSEVFGLNSFMGALVLWLALRLGPRSLSSIAFMIFLWAMGLGNNHTLVLFSPVLLIAAWPALRNQSQSAIPLFVGVMLLAFTIYLFIPIRASTLPVMDWEEPRTLLRFWKLVTRARYGTFQIAQGRVPTLGWDELQNVGGYVVDVFKENLHLWTLAMLAGLIGLLKSRTRREAWICLVIFLISGPVFFLLTHLRVTQNSRFILDRFFYLPMIPAVIFLGLGLGVAVDFVEQMKKGSGRVVLAIASLALVWQMTQPSLSRRQNLLVWDLGRDLLHNAPAHTLLLADRADEAEFALAYLQRAEHRRPDVEFIDCNAGVSRSMYGPDYYDIWGPPRLAIRTAVEKEWIARGDRPVYYATHEPQMIPIERVQEGLLYAASPPPHRRQLNWDEFFTLRVPPHAPGGILEYDRGFTSDYYQMLASDAMKSGDTGRAHWLYQAALAYAHPGPWREELQKFLAQWGSEHRS